MAHMIPPAPKEFDEKSDEGTVFLALKKLPDDYYVFHSVSVNDLVNNKVVEREIDFVVVNQKLGVLCIEAKNGQDIKYYDRAWHYSSGKLMPHDGPYNQAASAKRTLRTKMKCHDNADIRKISKHCKMFHSAWFFGMSKESFEEKNISSGLPEDALMELTMFAEDILDPKEAVERIFSLDIAIPALREEDEIIVETSINDEEFQMLLDSVFCPEFNLIPTPNAKSILMEEQMNQLLYEQYRLIDFLEDQNIAVINGAAGTGKTMIAVEKARRNSINGDKVLFLCYNRLLCHQLNILHKNNESKGYRRQFKNVDFMTIHQLTQKITGNYKDTDGLLGWFIDCMDDSDKFGYNHVIIDEGQDFGLIEGNEENNDGETNCSIIDALQDVALSSGGTFYLFYDKYQMIQGGGKVKYHLPSCIENSDCRLSLHYNCRNTKEIATTSVTPLRDQKNKAIKPKTACSWFVPVMPVMHVVGSEKKALRTLNHVLERYHENKIDDVVILVQGAAEFSMIADQLEIGTTNNEGYFLYLYDGVEYKVSTCIKFKGLEADAIVMIGLDKTSFTDYKGLEFYVGASRAKHYLDLIATLVPEDYAEVVAKLAPDAPQIKNQPEMMRGVLAEVFSAEVVTD